MNWFKSICCKLRSSKKDKQLELKVCDDVDEAVEKITEFKTDIKGECEINEITATKINEIEPVGTVEEHTIKTPPTNTLNIQCHAAVQGQPHKTHRHRHATRKRQRRCRSKETNHILQYLFKWCPCFCRCNNQNIRPAICCRCCPARNRINQHRCGKGKMCDKKTPKPAEKLPEEIPQLKNEHVIEQNTEQHAEQHVYDEIKPKSKVSSSENVIETKKPVTSASPIEMENTKSKGSNESQCTNCREKYVSKKMSPIIPEKKLSGENPPLPKEEYTEPKQKSKELPLEQNIEPIQESKELPVEQHIEPIQESKELPVEQHIEPVKESKELPPKSHTEPIKKSKVLSSEHVIETTERFIESPEQSEIMKKKCKNCTCARRREMQDFEFLRPRKRKINAFKCIHKCKNCP